MPGPGRVRAITDTRVRETPDTAGGFPGFSGITGEPLSRYHPLPLTSEPLLMKTMTIGRRIFALGGFLALVIAGLSTFAVARLQQLVGTVDSSSESGASAPQNDRPAAPKPGTITRPSAAPMPFPAERFTPPVRDRGGQVVTHATNGHGHNEFFKDS